MAPITGYTANTAARGTWTGPGVYGTSGAGLRPQDQALTYKGWYNEFASLEGLVSRALHQAAPLAVMRVAMPRIQAALMARGASNLATFAAVTVGTAFLTSLAGTLQNQALHPDTPWQAAVQQFAVGFVHSLPVTAIATLGARFGIGHMMATDLVLQAPLSAISMGMGHIMEGLGFVPRKQMTGFERFKVELAENVFGMFVGRGMNRGVNEVVVRYRTSQLQRAHGISYAQAEVAMRMQMGMGHPVAGHKGLGQIAREVQVGAWKTTGKDLLAWAGIHAPLPAGIPGHGAAKVQDEIAHPLPVAAEGSPAVAEQRPGPRLAVISNVEVMALSELPVPGHIQERLFAASERGGEATWIRDNGGDIVRPGRANHTDSTLFGDGHYDPIEEGWFGARFGAHAHPGEPIPSHEDLGIIAARARIHAGEVQEHSVFGHIERRDAVGAVIRERAFVHFQALHDAESDAVQFRFAVSENVPQAEVRGMVRLAEQIGRSAPDNLEQVAGRRAAAPGVEERAVLAADEASGATPPVNSEDGGAPGRVLVFNRDNLSLRAPAGAEGVLDRFLITANRDDHSEIMRIWDAEQTWLAEANKGKKEAAVVANRAEAVLDFIRAVQQSKDAFLTADKGAKRRQILASTLDHLEIQHLRVDADKVARGEVEAGKAIEEFSTDADRLAAYYDLRCELGRDDYNAGIFHRPRAAQAQKNADGSQKRVGFVSMGQGPGVFVLQMAGYNYKAYPEHRRFIDEHAPYLDELSRNQAELYLRTGGLEGWNPSAQIELMKWLKDPTTAPSDADLSNVDVSAGIIALVTRANAEIVGLRGFEVGDAHRRFAEHFKINSQDTNVKVVGATGTSQGVVALADLAGGFASGTKGAVKAMKQMGEAYVMSHPGWQGRETMAQVEAVMPWQIEAWRTEIAKELAPADDPMMGKLSVNPLTDTGYSISGSPEAIALLRLKIAECNKDKPDNEKVQIGKVLAAAAFHHERHMQRGYELTEVMRQQARTDTDGVNVELRSGEWEFPVFRTSVDGDGKSRPIHAASDPTDALQQDRSILSFDFRAQSAALDEAGAQVVIDLSGGATAKSFATNRVGRGIAAAGWSTKTGWETIFSTNPEAFVAPDTYRKAELGYVAHLGAEKGKFVNTPWLRAKQGATGHFATVGAQTPGTGEAAWISPYLKMGVTVGLASGFAGTHLEREMTRLGLMLADGGAEPETNLMVGWMGFDDQKAMVFKFRGEGKLDAGIEATAGIPGKGDPAKLADFIRECNRLGVSLPTFKIGPKAQVDVFLAMLKDNADLKGKFAITLEGGDSKLLKAVGAGGHHASEPLQKMWLESYDRLKAAGCLVGANLPHRPAAAGELSIPEQVALMLVQGALAFGPERPADFVVFGTVAQHFDVSAYTDAAQRISAKATSKQVVSRLSEAGMGQHLVDEGVPAGFVGTRDALEQLVGEVWLKGKGKDAEYKEFNPEQRGRAIALLNANGFKPWFWMRGGEAIHEWQMSWRETLSRFAELGMNDRGAWRVPKPELWNNAFVEMCRQAERRCRPAEVAEFRHLFRPEQAITDPRKALADLFARLDGAALDRPLDPGQDRAALLSIWRDVGWIDPVYFTAELDPKSLMKIFYRGATWGAATPGVEHPMVQSGGAVDYIHEARIDTEQFFNNCVQRAVALVESKGQTAREMSEPGGRLQVDRDMADLDTWVKVERNWTQEGDLQRLTYEVTDLDSLDAHRYRDYLVDSGRGTLRSVLDMRYVWEGGTRKAANHLADVFEPARGQVVDIVKDADGILRRIDVYENRAAYEKAAAAGDDAQPRIRLEATADRAATLTVMHETPRGKRAAVTYDYKVEDGWGYMPKLVENEGRTYETYDRILFPGGRPQKDADGVYTTTFEATRERIQAYNDAVRHVDRASVEGGADGKIIAPVSFEAAVGNDAVLAIAFEAVRDGSPLKLLHQDTRYEPVKPGHSIREGDHITVKARVVEERVSDSGFTRVAVCELYNKAGELVGRSRDTFVTQGKFADKTGFKREESQHRYELDLNGATRAALERGELGFRPSAGVRLKNLKGQSPLRVQVAEIEGIEDGRRVLRMRGVVTHEGRQVGTVNYRAESEANGQHAFFDSALAGAMRVVDASQAYDFKVTSRLRQALRDGQEGLRLRAGINAEDKSVIADDEPVRLALTQWETIDAQGQAQVHLSGALTQQGRIIGHLNFSAPRAAKAAHPFLDIPFFKNHATKVSDFKPFAVEKVVATVEDRTPFDMRAYALASGDLNPIHTDEVLGRKAGNPGRIVHGLMARARALRALATEVAGGDIERINHGTVEVDFRDKLPLGVALKHKIEEIGARKGRIVHRVTTTYTDAAGVEQPALIVTAEVKPSKQGFMFPGQGDQAAGMLNTLLADPEMQPLLARYDEHFRRRHGFSLIAMQQEGVKRLEFNPVLLDDGTLFQRQAVIHDNHVIDRTEMSQIALMAFYLATKRKLETRGLWPEDDIDLRLFGNSLGEYAIPAVAQRSTGNFERDVAIDLAILDLVFERGLTMQDFIDPLRDKATGESPFTMISIAAVKLQDIERIATDVFNETGLPVVVSNLNKPSQNNVVGPKPAVAKLQEKIEAFWKGEQARAGKTYESPVKKLPIDTPFHSEYLALGIPKFWRRLQALNFREMALALDGRYVPNIHGETFAITPEYITACETYLNGYEANLASAKFAAAKKYLRDNGLSADGPEGVETRLTDLHGLIGSPDTRGSIKAQLARYKAELTSGRGDRALIGDFLLKFGLAFQFASPTQLVKTQKSAYHPDGGLGIETLVEIGVGTTMKDIAVSTQQKIVGNQAVRSTTMKPTEVLSVGNPDDYKKIFHIHEKPKPAAKQAAKADAPEASAVPAQVARGAIPAPLPGRSLNAEFFLKYLLALALGKTPADIDMKQPFRSVGQSDFQNGVLDGVNAEFSAGGVNRDTGKAMPFEKAAEQIETKSGGVKDLGAELKKQFGEGVAMRLEGLSSVAKGGSGDATFYAKAKAYYLETYGKTVQEGEIPAVILHGMLTSRPIAGAKDALVLKPGTRANAKEWLDKVLLDYAKEEHGIDRVLTDEQIKEMGGGAGEGINWEEVAARLDEREAQRALEHIGLDIRAVREALRMMPELQAQVGQLLRDRDYQGVASRLGETLAKFTGPVFDADKIREITLVATGAEMVDFLYGLKRDLRRHFVTPEAAAPAEILDTAARARLDLMANRAEGHILDVLAYQRDRVTRQLAEIDAGFPMYQKQLADTQIALAAKTKTLEALSGVAGIDETIVPRLQAEAARAQGLVEDITVHIELVRASGRAEAPILRQWLAQIDVVETRIRTEFVDGQPTLPRYRPDQVSGFERLVETTDDYGLPTVNREPKLRPDGLPSTTRDLIAELRAGGTLKDENGEVVKHRGRPVHIDYLRARQHTTPDAHWDPKVRDRFLTAMEDVAANGLSLQRPTDGAGVSRLGLFNGTSSLSINEKNLIAYLQGGGRAIVAMSGSDYNKVEETPLGTLSRVQYYQKLGDLYKGRGAEVILLNHNMGSPEDCKKLLTELDNRNLIPDDVFLYGALPGGTDLTMLADMPTQMDRVMATVQVQLLGMTALAGGITRLHRDRLTNRKANIVISGSPNDGLIAGGGYTFVQAAKHALYNLWHTDASIRDPKSGDRLMRLFVHEYGWFFGTGQMAQNDGIAPEIARRGLKVFSPGEGAPITMTFFHPDIQKMADAAPFIVTTEAGMRSALGFNTSEIYTQALNRVQTNRAAAEAIKQEREQAAQTRAQAAGGADPEGDDVVIHQPWFGLGRGPEIMVRADKPILSNINPDKVVVVLRGDEWGAGGDRFTRRGLQQAQYTGKLGDPHLLRLAQIMGRIRFDTSKGWVECDTPDGIGKNGRPIHVGGVREKFEDWILDHVFVRRMEPEMNMGFDPANDQILAEVVLPTAYCVRDLDEKAMHALRQDGDRVESLGGGRYNLYKPEGTRVFVQGHETLDRLHAAQIPTGVDYVRDGFPEEFIKTVDPATIFAMRALASAMLGLNLDPRAIHEHPDLALRTGLYIGAGLGPMNSASALYILSLLAREKSGADLFGRPQPAGAAMVQGLTNMPNAEAAAILFQHFLGPKGTTVAACSTALLALQLGMYAITHGDVDLAFTGGTESPLGPAAFKRFAKDGVGATIMMDYLKKNGIPERDAAQLVLSMLAAGFTKGQGAAVVPLARLSTALELGLPIEAILLGVTNVSGGSTANLPSPDRGPAFALPLMMQRMARYGITPDNWKLMQKLVEMHGTGTVAGDGSDLINAANAATFDGHGGFMAQLGNLLFLHGPKGDLGHTMGAAGAMSILQGLDVFCDGLLTGFRGLQSPSAKVRAQMAALALSSRGIQIDPRDLEILIVSAFGFGREGEQAFLANPEMVSRIVPGRRYTDYRIKRDRRLQEADDRHGRIIVGRDKLVNINPDLFAKDETLADAASTSDAKVYEMMGRHNEWLAEMDHRSRAGLEAHYPD